MNKKLTLLSITISILLFIGCTESDFPDDITNADFGAPKNLTYSEVLNAREFALLNSGVPAIDTDGLVPSFEIVSVRRGDGTILDASFIDDVSIQNPIESIVNLTSQNNEGISETTGETITTFDTRSSGVITIADGNKFEVGDYFFTVRVTTTAGERVLSTTFEDIFHINVGPQLVTNLLYVPIAQNLNPGTVNSTTQPILVTGNADVTFELLTETDRLDIDPQTGVVTIKPGIVFTEDPIMPMVEVTSNISGEKTQFQGREFLYLVVSDTPMDLGPISIFFFYPTLESEGKQNGYIVDIQNEGLVAPGNIWNQTGPTPLANLDTSLPTIEGKKAIVTNVVVRGISEPHNSDVIINTQDLSQYKLGFDNSTVFYIQNRFVEYLSDGSTPTDLQIFYSTDFINNNAAATWIPINDQVSCQINSLTAPPFIGTPYPGDQNGPDPDNRKDSSRNADGRWVRCEFDLNPFKEEKNFTLRFSLRSFFEGPINGPAGRAGRYLISDVYPKIRS